MVTSYSLSIEANSPSKQATCRDRSAIAHSFKLGWILVNKNIISQTQLESALTIQFRYEQKLGELLIEQKLISHKQLEQALKEQYWRRNGYWVI